MRRWLEENKTLLLSAYVCLATILLLLTVFYNMALESRIRELELTIEQCKQHVESLEFDLLYQSRVVENME